MEIVRSVAPIRFMWIPGIRPVIMPAKSPSKRVRKISKSMKF